MRRLKWVGPGRVQSFMLLGRVGLDQFTCGRSPFVGRPVGLSRVKTIGPMSNSDNIHIERKTYQCTEQIRWGRLVAQYHIMNIHTVLDPNRVLSSLTAELLTLAAWAGGVVG